MFDPRFDALAEVLAGFSTRLQKGEKALIDVFDIPPEMVVSLIRKVREKGALPFVNLQSNIVNREMLRGADQAQFQTMASYELARMQAMNAYIAVRGSYNITEHSDVPSDRMLLAMKLLKPVLEHRVNKTKWVVLRWPSPSMAQLSGMSTEAFEEFFFRVCTLDYARMETAMQPLKRLMDKTDQVHITGPGTDLRFSIKGIPTIACGGQHNIPDGEVFTCPVKDSAEGYIQYNTPTIYQGTAFDSVRLGFSKGRIVEASANETAVLNKILDSDDGARYLGEFALALTRMCGSQCAISCSMKRSPAHSISRRARLTKRLTMATAARFTGISSASSGQSTAAAKSASTASSFAKMASSSWTT